MKKEKRNIQFKIHKSPYEASFVYDEDQSMVTIDNRQSFTINEKSASTIGVYSLSNDCLSWLVITETDIHIAAM
ncbi:hypothetical protein F7731_04700 [Cytobacillus depressus]|uniref:Uncharacterized protein n=1 Tax=Cytobacillus depressus TaxID=1602942 RepID=A0A6L3VHJ0_9BACI|nr:hypothetical protein [Cytobacillus depressus]KAB2338854.1 hypothetical protein F7731_04700 [Cytobacillus depressus]